MDPENRNRKLPAETDERMAIWRWAGEQ